MTFFRRNKFHAIPTEYNGVRYASKSEAARAQELDMLESAGEINWWIGQPRFHLGSAEAKYVADFLVCGKDGEGHWTEDVKGMVTQKFARDKKLWKAYGKMPLHILKRKKNGWTREIIEIK